MKDNLVKESDGYLNTVTSIRESVVKDNLVKESDGYFSTVTSIRESVMKDNLKKSQTAVSTRSRLSESLQ